MEPLHAAALQSAGIKQKRVRNWSAENCTTCMGPSFYTVGRVLVTHSKSWFFSARLSEIVVHGPRHHRRERWRVPARAVAAHHRQGHHHAPATSLIVQMVLSRMELYRAEKLLNHEI